MKILWIPQVSSKSSSGELLLTKDSNIAFLSNLLSSDFGAKNEIDIAFEFNVNKELVREILHSKVHDVFANQRNFTDAYNERFCFDSSFFASLAKNKYDIIFVNEPTKVVPLKHIFADAKVVTYCHWLAVDNMQEIILRQVEGIAAADCAMFNSFYAIEHLLDKCKGIEAIRNANLIKVQPCFAGLPSKLKRRAKKNIIYNHRVSSDPYYAKAFESFTFVIKSLKNKLLDSGIEPPKVYITNPSGKDVAELCKQLDIIEMSVDKVCEYESFLKSDEISIHVNTFFESSGMWSMSTVDAAVCGNACFVPKKFGYAEIFDRSYKGYCSSEFEMVEKLFDFFVSDDNEDFDCSKSVVKHSAESIGFKLNVVLSSLLLAKSSIVYKPWGLYVTEYRSITQVQKIIRVFDDEELSLQKHNIKQETWAPISGAGVLTLEVDGILTKRVITRPDVVLIQPGVLHSVKAIGGDFIFSEVSRGDIVSEDDIIRVQDKYGRACEKG